MLDGVRCSLVTVLVVGMLGGCGGASEEASAPEPVTGAPKQVAKAVSDLERATVKRDFDAICDELFSSDARARAGGDDCAASLGEDADGVRAPRIQLLSIRIDGQRASVRVRTSAASQPSVDETIELVREDGRYLIAALGG